MKLSLLLTYPINQELQENAYEDQIYERLVDMGHCFSPSFTMVQQWLLIGYLL